MTGPVQTATVLGVDPGPVPGIVRLAPDGRIDVVQCSARVAAGILAHLAAVAGDRVLIALEAFVVSGRAARSSTPEAGRATRELIGALDAELTGLDDVYVMQRRAADVMPWATDRRLDAAGLLDATKGMRHTRAAARHALYAACHDCGLPDPLARRSRPDRSPTRKASP